MEGRLVLGIDFGTSNSCVSIWRADKKRAKIIKNSHNPGSKTTPSCITFSSVGFEEYLIGVPGSSANTVKGIKNLLGRTHKDLHSLQHVRSSLPTLHIAEETCDNDPLEVCCYDSAGNMEVFSPEHLVSLILRYLRTCAATYLRRKPMRAGNQIIYPNDPLTRVVLGIPANFSEKARYSMRSAAELAGFTDISFAIESTAAAMAYGLLVAGNKRVLVYDMGGGTTDISILRVNAGVAPSEVDSNDSTKSARLDNNANRPQIVVEYTGGCSTLGGQLIDQLLCGYIMKQLKEDAILSSEEERQLLQLCTLCKERLTTENSFTFEEDWLNRKRSLPSVLLCVTKEQFESEVLRDTVCRSVNDFLTRALQQSRQDAGMKGEVDEIVVVGGSSRVPCILDTLRRTWRDWRCKHRSRKDPSLVMDKELCQSVNPEQCVAEGLAIRGAILSQCIDSADFLNENGRDANRLLSEHKLKHWLMLDCLPHTLGLLLLDADGPFFQPILSRGSSLPCMARHTISLDQPQAPDKTSAHSWFSQGNRRKLATLDIYEEIEDAAVVAVATNSHASESERNDSKRVQNPVDVQFSYHLLRSVSVRIEEALPSRSKDDGSLVNVIRSETAPETVTVVFAVNADGVLSYSVHDGAAPEVDDNDDSLHPTTIEPNSVVDTHPRIASRSKGSRSRNGGNSRSRSGSSSSSSSSSEWDTSVGLGVVLSLLLVLYVALKSQVLGIPSPTGFLFPDDRNDAVEALL